MCALFKNKYRIGSRRCQGFDYSSNGIYFVTICTKNRTHYFGKIENAEMKLSELGICLRDVWLKTPSIRPDMNIFLDEFVIMPDHFHGIIIIGKNRYNENNARYRRHAMHGVSTTSIIDKPGFHNVFKPQSKNLSSIIRGVKSSVTIFAKKNKLEFKWQPRFHDHIIRTNTELNRIRRYLIENPLKWK